MTEKHKINRNKKTIFECRIRKNKIKFSKINTSDVTQNEPYDSLRNGIKFS